MSYLVQYAPAALRSLKSVPRDVQRRIVAQVDALASDPRPRGTTSLKGSLKGLRRLRVGDYRACYLVDDEALRVRIIEIGHRAKTYEHLTRRDH
jgi:mRNA interferase RelE/StbE